jgi:hypothetical protein
MVASVLAATSDIEATAKIMNLLSFPVMLLRAAFRLMLKDLLTIKAIYYDPITSLLNGKYCLEDMTYGTYRT